MSIDQFNYEVKRMRERIARRLEEYAQEHCDDKDAVSDVAFLLKEIRNENLQ